MAEKLKDLVGAEPVVAPALTGDQFAQLLEVLARNKTVEADLHAEAMQRALQKSDPNPPRKSAYNPRGDRDFPRPELRCPMFFGQYKLDPATLTYEELELLNQLKGGEYKVTKADGTVVAFTVTPTMNKASGELEKITIYIPAKDDNKNFMPLTTMLKDVLQQQKAS